MQQGVCGRDANGRLSLLRRDARRMALSGARGERYEGGRVFQPWTERQESEEEAATVRSVRIFGCLCSALLLHRGPLGAEKV